MQPLSLIVAQSTIETPIIRRITLTRPDGGVLPAYAAGAHVRIALPDGQERAYSLLEFSTDPQATSVPRRYTLGVRLEEESAGGSRYLHSLRTGDAVTISDVRNDFPLTPGDGPVLLLAGGIGVTPLITMAAAMSAAGRPWRLVYAGRSRSQLAFLPDIAAIKGGTAEIHCDDEAGSVLDAMSVFDALPAGVPVHACGPKPMLKAAMAAARKLGWPAGRLRFELFYSVAGPGAAAPA